MLHFQCASQQTFSRGYAKTPNQGLLLRTFDDAKVPFCARSERLQRLFVSFAFIRSQRFFITFKFNNDGPLL